MALNQNNVHVNQQILEDDIIFLFCIEKLQNSKIKIFSKSTVSDKFYGIQFTYWYFLRKINPFKLTLLQIILYNFQKKNFLIFDKKLL